MPVAAAPAAAAAAAAQAADAAPAEDAPPPAAEKAVMTVKLESFEASAKAKIIREVKALLGCNLVEAKNMVEKAPTILKENVVKDVTALPPTTSKLVGRKESQGNDRETRRKDNFVIVIYTDYTRNEKSSTHKHQPNSQRPVKMSFSITPEGHYRTQTD